MTKHYNRSSEKEKRRKLRQNKTNAEELLGNPNKAFLKIEDSIKFLVKKKL